MNRHASFRDFKLKTRLTSKYKIAIEQNIDSSQVCLQKQNKQI